MLEILPPLQPRRYSAASSGAADCRQLRLILNVVDGGLCSSWLDELPVDDVRVSSSVADVLGDVVPAVAAAYAHGFAAGVSHSTSTAKSTSDVVCTSEIKGPPRFRALESALKPVAVHETSRLDTLPSTIAIYHERNAVSFNPPIDTSRAVIMVATGTGYERH